MKITGYDFSGWATKNDLRCADNRVIRKDAFKVQDGAKVPLIWNHKHDSTSAVLGHAILENKDDGVFTYGFFNNTSAGKEAKEILQHGDVVSLSIYANNLVQDGMNVLHGAIREISLVLAGANPGAFVESVVAHGESVDEFDEEAIFYTGDGIYFEHSEDVSASDSSDGEASDDAETEDEDSEDESKEEKTMAKTAREIYDSMTDEQKELLYNVVDELSPSDDGDGESVSHSALDEEDYDMKKNVFDAETQGTDTLSHSAILGGMLEDAKTHRAGSLKEVINDGIEAGALAHAVDTTGMTVGNGDWRDDIPSGRPTVYGFNDPDMLFPEAKSLNTPPEWIQRNMDWVTVVLNGVHRSPFSRIKSQYANITEDEARAKGYTKTHKKTEEMFSVLKRVTTPTTIYKKQRMDRDDIIDITDFDVVAWIKGEMRVMLNEELARAIVFGDGRTANHADKIDEGAIRPIIKDDPLFNTKVPVSVSATATGSDKGKAIINAVIRSRKNYKGSGNPILFTTEDWVTEMLLIEDGIGHKLYKTEQELATALRVSRIVTSEVAEGQKVDVTTSSGGSSTTVQKDFIGVIVNPVDYNVGADKGGSIELFDDFDIDFNQYVWLMETRISGALVKPYSAITLYLDQATAAAG